MKQIFYLLILISTFAQAQTKVTFCPEEEDTSPIAFGASGTIVSGTTTALVPLVADIAIGNGLFIHASSKAVEVDTPPGWTLISSVSGGLGTDGVADEGVIYDAVFFREADGTETAPTLEATPTAAGVITARMYRYTKSTTKDWSISAATDIDNTATTDFEISPTLALAADDYIMATGSINGNTYTLATPALSASGLTTSGVTVRNNSNTNNGTDLYHLNYTVLATAGTSSAPIFTITASGSGASTPTGAGHIVRLRQIN